MMEHRKANSSISNRKIKVKRRIQFASPEDLSPDDDDITTFLASNPSKVSCPRYYPNGQIISHSIIGPVSLFETDANRRANNRKSTMVMKKRAKEEEIDPKVHFKQILDRISLRSKMSADEDQLISNTHSQRQRLEDKRQSQAIQSYQKRLNYWSGIQKTIANKSQRDAKELLCTKSSSIRASSNTPEKIQSKTPIQSRLLWYMKLRESKDDPKLETFVKVGSGGLYTRVQARNHAKSLSVSECAIEHVEDEIELNEEDLNELKIIGIAKLPMEIEAVNRLGCEYLRLDLLDLNTDEEVIAEHYEKKTKARLV